MEYIRRIVDQEIDKRITAFNAINIIGPKGSGKTRTAQERCNMKGPLLCDRMVLHNLLTFSLYCGNAFHCAIQDVSNILSGNGEGSFTFSHILKFD